MMRVFLRVKPIADNNKSCIKFESATTIRAQPPKDSNAYKNKTQGVMMDHHFTFTKILGPEASQQKVFDETMINILEEVIDGKNCLVFAYGATGAGKTHTIQGNLSDPGIMIRTLDVLFNTLEGKLSHKTHVKPYLGQVTLLNEKGEEEEREYKESILKGLPNVDFDGTYLSDFSIASRNAMCSTKLSGGSDAGDHSQASTKSQSSEEFVSVLSAKLPQEEVFSVWVSFAEVYNEGVFDLLDPKLHKKPVQLKVMVDNEGTNDVYIKNLSEVQVFSAEEAYKILLVGRGNLKVAATKFNHVSSRSHSIFTVKLIKIPNVDDPGYFCINRLSFCDLAGSERSGKVNSCSSRLKEAGNINTSLMVLGRCIETLKHNQKFPHDKKPVPVRDSKLTRIFQGFFLGIGRAYMVTNISQAPDQFDETLHVLKFSALAQQVVSQDLRSSRLSTVFLHPVDSSEFESDSDEDNDGDIMNSSLAHMFREHLHPKHLLSAIVTLEAQFVETINNFETERQHFKKELLQREMEVRAELCAQYEQKRFQMEEEHRMQLRDISDQGAADTQRVFQFMNTVMVEKKEPVPAVIIKDERPTCKDAESQVTPRGQAPVQCRISDKRSDAVLQNVIRNTIDVATQVIVNTNDVSIQVMPHRKDVAIQEDMIQLKPVQEKSSNSSDNEENVLPNEHRHSKRMKKTVKKTTKFEELSPPARNAAKQARTKSTKAQVLAEVKKDDVTVPVTPKLRKLRVRKAQI